MGAWGTEVSSNDTYSDIYGEFIDLYNSGLTVPEITQQLIDKNQETINLPEDAANFWFALANGQWECKALDKDILKKIEGIIETGEDLAVWKELDASPADLEKRAKVLNKFLAKLQTEKVKPRRQTKKKLFNSIFKKGDCLVYVMENGNYGGAFVLTDEQQTETGTNYIAITTLDKREKPTMEDFVTSEVYTKREKKLRLKNSDIIEDWIDRPQIGGFSAVLFEKYGIDIEVLGQLPICYDYKVGTNEQVGFGWGMLQSTIPFKEEYIKLNGSAALKLKLSKWTRKRWLGIF